MSFLWGAAIVRLQLRAHPFPLQASASRSRALEFVFFFMEKRALLLTLIALRALLVLLNAMWHLLVISVAKASLWMAEHSARPVRYLIMTLS